MLATGVWNQSGEESGLLETRLANSFSAEEIAEITAEEEREEIFFR